MAEYSITELGKRLLGDIALQNPRDPATPEWDIFPVGPLRDSWEGRSRQGTMFLPHTKDMSGGEVAESITRRESSDVQS